MKKRILINIHYLEIGGAETALIGLLHALDPDIADVDLMLNDKRGEMLNFVPDWVNIIDVPQEYAFIERPIKETLRKGYFKIAAARIWAKFKHYRYVKKNRAEDGNAIFGYVAKYVTSMLPDLSFLGEYDIAISFLSPHNIVLDKVKARKKLCWIHTDYSSIDIDRKIEFPVWNGYDRIVSISRKVTEAFCSVFPRLKEKIIEVENILPEEFIRKRSEEFQPTEMKRENGETIFLTIGRYCYAKNLESIPKLCRMIREKGINLKWFIIGYGGSDDYIREEIHKEGMENNVILLGKKANPYPYIKACDRYVQPSRYEGKSITVEEARILGIPIIITDYPTAHSQIEQGKDGYILPSTPDEFAEKAYQLMNVPNYTKDSFAK